MIKTSRQALVLTTDRLTIRLLEPEDAAKMLHFRLENKDHLAQWEPTRRIEFFTENFWRFQAQGLKREFMQGQSVCLCLFVDGENELAGVCNFTNIVRGTFQSCHLGYALARKFEGQGMMSEALREVCRYMFDVEQLHRIMANYLPRNDRSGQLLASLGFEIEGHAKQYLKINGHWEDHVLTSLINPSHA